MIKKILVPASGSATDEHVFATALAVARPLNAHLQFYHLRLSEGEAAAGAPHVDFCVGSALPLALDFISHQQEELASRAADHFKSFCAQNGISVQNTPTVTQTISASWCEEINYAAGRLTLQARHSDLVVLGRPQHADYMPSMLVEDLVVGCGRPIVIAANSSPKSVTGTVVVGWQETPEAARALSAALPLLARAQKVVLVNIAHNDTAMLQTLQHLVSQLAWHGIAAEACVIQGKPSRAVGRLTQVAAELHADLLVVGGFGHGPLRELVLGGVTQSLIDQAELPVFVLH